MSTSDGGREGHQRRLQDTLGIREETGLEWDGIYIPHVSPLPKKILVFFWIHVFGHFDYAQNTHIPLDADVFGSSAVAI
jgi:hypothetical protein